MKSAATLLAPTLVAAYLCISMIAIDLVGGQSCTDSVQSIQVRVPTQSQSLINVRQAQRILIRCSTCTSVDTGVCLDSVQQTFQILASPQLSTINFPQLHVVGRDFTVTGPLPALGSLNIPQIRTIGQGLNGPYNFDIVDTPIPSINFPNLGLVSHMDISSNPALEWMSFPELVSAADFTITNNANLTSLARTTAEPAFPRLLATNVFNISNNGALREILGFFGHSTSTSFTLDNNSAITRIRGFTSLTSPGPITISNNPSLGLVAGFNKVNFIDGNLTVTNNPVLEGTGWLNNCSRVEGDVILETSGIREVNGLINIQQIGGDLIVDQDPRLASTSPTTFASLAFVNGSYRVTNNAILDSVHGFNNLTCVESSLRIRNNPSLQSVDGFGALRGYDCNDPNKIIVDISDNGPLGTLGGFGTAQYLEGLTITNNIGNAGNGGRRRTSIPAQGLIGFGSLGFVRRGINISANANLTRITGMSSGPTSTIPSGPITINDNEGMLHISGLNNFANVNEVTIERNPQLQLIVGFQQLTSTSVLSISNNELLEFVTGFPHLANLTGLVVRGNNQLADIRGFAGLRRVVGKIRFDHNNRLNESLFEPLRPLECHDGVYNDDPVQFCQNCPTWLLTKPRCTPTESPTFGPSVPPTRHPTGSTPSEAPTTNTPTVTPSVSLPTVSPTSSMPTSSPTFAPTVTPTTSTPTVQPVPHPTGHPTPSYPTISPSKNPTTSPTVPPTRAPSTSPTDQPTLHPSMSPTISPTFSPSISPTVSPTVSPSNIPTPEPTYIPTTSPTTSPSSVPSSSPTYSSPTMAPTEMLPTCLMDNPIFIAGANTADDEGSSSINICWPLVIILALLLMASLFANWWMWKKMRSSALAEKVSKIEDPRSTFGAFENPTYDSTGGSAMTRSDSVHNPAYAALSGASGNDLEPVYIDSDMMAATARGSGYEHAQKAVGGGTGGSEYMDSHAAVAAVTGKVGYFDVQPSASTGVKKPYMDVQPTALSDKKTYLDVTPSMAPTSDNSAYEELPKPEELQELSGYATVPISGAGVVATTEEGDYATLPAGNMASIDYATLNSANSTSGYAIVEDAVSDPAPAVASGGYAEAQSSTPTDEQLPMRDPDLRGFDEVSIASADGYTKFGDKPYSYSHFAMPVTDGVDYDGFNVQMDENEGIEC